MADWLCLSLTRPDAADGRSILRFADPGHYRLLSRALRDRGALAGRHARGARELALIRAFVLPFPADRWPAAWRKYAVAERDAPLRAAALPKGVTVRDKGIPWGVRHVRAPQAWSRTTGLRVRIGVIDTGVDFQHPDLRHSLERGINLLNRTALPQDDNGHGTHIAGTIAAANELQGMIGVAPRSTIVPIKAFDHNGTAYVSDIILGIDWCVRNRIDVVNMSFGMRSRSKSLFQAVTNAWRSGVLIVASSGNDGRQGDIDYPAKYSHTISVGALGRQGRIAPFTNRSPLIDIFAPGEKIVSAWLRGKHREMSGTSMATSHVTGAIALLLGLRPELSPAQIKSILKRSAMPLRHARAPRMAGELDISRMLKLVDSLKE